MPNPVQTNLQVGNPSQGTVSRQPQTTEKSIAGAPFVRLSRKAQTKGFNETGLAYGALLNKELKAAGGYLRSLRLRVTSTGGTGGGAVPAADAPFNVIKSLMLRDPLGQPIVNTDGFGLMLINKYSGQAGEGKASDPTQLPSYDVSDIANGNFTFELEIPLELDSAAYCALSSLNAAAQPSIDIEMSAMGTVFTTPPDTNQPVLAVRLNEPFWAVPINDSSLAPPDAGSSHQWTLTKGGKPVTDNTGGEVNNTRVGTWITTIIACMRDNTGARVDGYGNTVILQLDGVPVLIEAFDERVDEMARFTDGIARDTGVIAYSFRDAVKQVISKADTHDLLLSTTPATLLELVTDPTAIANSPAVVQFYTGQLFPVNAQRIPYTHLAE